MNRKFVSLAVLLLMSVAAIYWVATRPKPEAPEMPKAPAIEVQKTSAELRVERVEYFDSDVTPLIAEADRLNREAAIRCIERLEEAFAGYRTGINPFCEEINTWWTRSGVLYRMPSDWWYGKSDVGEYIQAKFAKHLFSDEKLKADIESSITQFRKDVEANKSALIAKVRVSISKQDISGLPEIDYTEFSETLVARLTAYSQQAANDSVVNGIVIEIATGVAGYVVGQVLAQIITRLTATAATTTVAAGGTTAVTATAGGAGGSTLGPAGTFVGIGVGLAVGVVIDWWMSSEFEAKMTKQLNELVDDLEREVVAGDVGRTGLREGLRGSCDVMLNVYKDSLRSRIVNGATK